MDEEIHVPRQRDSAWPAPAGGLPPGGVDGRKAAPAAGALRALARDAADAVVEHVQAELGMYSGPATGRWRELIRTTAAVGTGAFLESCTGGHPDHAHVADVFRRIGEAAAIERDDLDTMAKAWRVGTGRALEFFSIHPIPGTAARLRQPNQLDSSLRMFTASLFQHVTRGFQHPRWRHDPRARLLAELALTPPHRPLTDDVTALAALARWPLPDRLVVGIVEPLPLGSEGRRQETRLDPSATSGWLLLRPHHGWLVFAADALAFGEHRDELLRRLGGAVTAFCWPTDRVAAHEAYRIAKRALRLRREGGIGPEPIIDCARHVNDLLLASAPRMRDHLLEALAPLEALKPGERSRLAETLFEDLAMPGSARELADRLGVHPNTVRNHRAKLEALFGHALQDPEVRVHLLLAVRSVLPRWRRPT